MAMADILGEHFRRLDAWQHQFGATKKNTGEVQSSINAETQAQLRALGYLGD